MADIFISYAREDAEPARQLAAELEKCGWSVFWDRRIPAGRRFADVIVEHLGAAKCVIALWSRAANDSDWVLEEAEEARKRNILAPALIEAIEPPWGFRRINAADLIGWRGESTHAGFQQLLEDIVHYVAEQKRPAASGEKHQKPREVLRTGIRLFEELKRRIQAFRPDTAWALYQGSRMEGWWFLRDNAGHQLVRAKPLTNLLRVRIRKNLHRPTRPGTAINYTNWICEDESSVVRNDRELGRVLKQIEAEWAHSKGRPMI